MDALYAMLMAFATANYGVDGWDYFVECWSVSDVAEVVAKLGTDDFEAVKADIGASVKLVAEVEEDVRGWGGEFD
jgi:hypothetical protein